jgi:hypothetical protein
MDTGDKVLIAAVVVASIVLGVFIGLAIDNSPRALVGPFTDTVGHPYAWAIEEIRLAGLTAGCQTEPAMYCPDRPLTRGEAAVMLARLLER